MPPATPLQLARLKTLALTRDVTCGKFVTMRADRKRVLARVTQDLDKQTADALIVKWESADEIKIAWESRPDYLGAYRAQGMRKLGEKIFLARVYKAAAV